MKKKLTALVLGLTMLCSPALFLGGCSQNYDIVVGSKSFTEQLILAPMLQILIEENTDLRVKLSDNMSGMAVWGALKSGAVDTYVDYTGTIYGDYLQGDIAGKTATEIYDELEPRLSDELGIKMLESLGFNNTYVFAVTQATAAKYNLSTISDMLEVIDELTLGCNAEFPDRGDTLSALKSRFGKEFGTVQIFDYGARYQALLNGNTDVCDAFSTDGMLVQHNLVVLEDDINMFPPYFAVPLVREDTLEKFPELEDVILSLCNVITDNEMAQLNKKVDVDGMDESAVAREFLEQKGLI